jgi:hypothetical protein
LSIEADEACLAQRTTGPPIAVILCEPTTSLAKETVTGP